MPSSIPLATYRLQFTPSFGFNDAVKIVPYLKALGISHLYASPFLKARSGSTHGYDIIDHNAFNPEIGGEEAFLRLSDALAQADIGLILDFVPNHMGVQYADNVWWLDTLEWGPKSPHAASFDIEWDTLPERPRGGVLLPLLGGSYGEVLESGDLELRYDAREGSFSVWYFEHRLPIGPSRYGEILTKAVASADAENDAAGRKLLDLAKRYRGPRNPPRDEAGAFKAELAAVTGGAEIIERGLKAYRPKSGDPGAVLALHHLLERQYYRPAHWRLAGAEINYRRFFDINSLAGIRVEDARTFEAIHRLVTRLIAEGRLQGLRLDHIDGLRDPRQYLRRLQALTRSASKSGAPFYVVIEKILAEHEPLPQFAGTAGTTGYEWLNVISRVLVHPAGLEKLDATWREAGCEQRSFPEILMEAKRRVLNNLLESEFTVLARLLARIAAGHYSTRDFASERLRAALEAFILHFPVYRTYITATGPTDEDRAVINGAIANARANWFGTDHEIFDFLRDALTLDLVAPGRRGHSIARVRRFALKVQQFTGPMMAKSLEDTAFYRYHRLLALNEVGGEPDASAIPVTGFHARMQARARDWPNGLTATATHDTKRGEDARARILALSEMPEEWDEAVRRWRSLNASLIAAEDAFRSPSRAHEYMLYQALLGAWPLEGIDKAFVERTQAYALKAAREGKEQTTWLSPNERYENALTDFVRRVLSREESSSFIDSFDQIARRAALMGALNSLSQITLKATMPGVPDFYQGTELWDFSYVDPDNRRPVEFRGRAAGLAQSGENPEWQALAHDWRDGSIKLALTRRLIAIRQQFAEAFTDGSYRALEVTGPHADEVIAFARSSARQAVVVVVGRLFGRATARGSHWPSPQAWENTEVLLPGFSDIRPLLSADTSGASSSMAVSRLFQHLPVAVLQATPTRPNAKLRNPSKPLAEVT